MNSWLSQSFQVVQLCCEKMGGELLQDDQSTYNMWLQKGQLYALKIGVVRVFKMAISDRAP